MRIFTFDTTLRDGTQGEAVSFTADDKLLIAQKLDELGVDYIEGGWPGSNLKDKDFFARAGELNLKHARLVAFGATRFAKKHVEEDSSLQAIIEAGTPVVSIFGKSWDLHVRRALGVTEEENLAMIAETVRYLKAQGKEVVYDAEHFFDGHRLNPEFALKTIQAAQEGGAEIVVLCDTNGGSLPERIAIGVEAARGALKVPVGIHCHNDCDVATANSLAAVRHGAIQVQGTVNGVGERCGNVDLISVVANLAIKEGHEVLVPDGVSRLTELSRYVYEIANMNFRANQAFVGMSAFAHKGGMHVHAVNRVSQSYEHIDPETVGNERRILVSELSGRSNIVAKLGKYGGDDNPELMKKILDRVQELESEGYQFEAAEASFDLLVMKAAGTYEPKFVRDHYRVNVVTDEGGQPVTEATIKLTVGGAHEHVVAEGDGPVNALDTALRKALASAYPRLAEMHLDDYKVRVINSTEGTAARVRVMIESRDRDNVWTTVGVSENVIEASWLALVDSVEYKLFKDLGGLGQPTRRTTANASPARH